MSLPPPCLLTSKDYSILEVMLERCPLTESLLRAMLRSKVDSARVVFRDDIPPNVVTLNSRVRYRVNDAPAQTRLIGQDEVRGPVGSLLPITQPRGLAMLGVAEGESYPVPSAGGDDDILQVLEVVYQPEAAMRERCKLGLANSMPRIRLVHYASRPALQVASAGPAETDHDPGPSAA
jgi:regulator of nucleoside diphosphate kinase